ncbi:MAG: glycosyltransferase family 4 protein [Bacillota bacterium]
MYVSKQTQPLKIAFVSTFQPRQCGIATYAFDLFNSIKQFYTQERGVGEQQDLCEVVALNNNLQNYNYGKEVTFHIRDQHRGDYRRAADFLNLSPVDVVSLQHEFGIFGGDDGNYILNFISALKKPLVTTLHTVLREPTPGQKKTLGLICEKSVIIVVMARMADKLLKEVYGVPDKKIAMLHHGAPDVPFLDSSYYKDQLQAEGRKVLLTFGLLSPGKGLEYAIEAMEHVVAAVPDALYIVLGATHPEVKRRYGEQYRHSLEKMVREKGLQNNVTFFNQYVTLERLVQFLVATDIYITPYISREQVVSGTLAYAMACGKAIVSTPYWYAEEMLDEGRGCLVPFKDSGAMAGALIKLLQDEALRNRMRKLTYQFGRQMVWQEVAGEYSAAFESARHEYNSYAIALPQRAAVTRHAVLPEINMQHLRNLTDDTGLFQHAVFNVPDRSHGYCTDDNARALIVAVQNWQLFKDETILPLINVYLSFMHSALLEDTGRVHNFLSYQRCWLDEQSSEDCHGRYLWALGYVIAYPVSEAVLSLASRLFKVAVGAPLAFTSPRAWAFSVLGALYYLKRFGGDTEVRALVADLCSRLRQQTTANATEDWYWCEDVVTYDNARLPQALIAAGHYLNDQQILNTGLKSLDWLISVQTDPVDGHLSLIGNDGWYPRGGGKARYDQQPLDAAALVSACSQAYLATGQFRWRMAMDWSFNWFFGNNDARQILLDYAGGGCFDGVQPGGINRNQGAESTLSLLMSLHQMHKIEHEELIHREDKQPPAANESEQR